MAILAGCTRRSHAASDKHVIVIGVDGMDPGFVERHWGDLPNLARLRERGWFARLATTTPPQSPVAWSTFITGLDPAQHGIFDFVERDPETMQPFSSLGDTEEPRFRLPLGPYRIPLTSARVRTRRNGKPFWEILSEQGIPVMIVRLPVNYPPSRSGDELAGMGTPDLRGSEGTFTYFSDDPGEIPRTVDGGVILKPILSNGHAELSLEGPPNSLRADSRPAHAVLSVDIDPEKPFATVATGTAQAVVEQGEWSGWLPLEFPLIDHLVSVRGMVRVFAKQLHPQFEMYVSPVNVDPAAPALPISTPASFSRDVAQDVGRYSTLGIPEDTAALRQGVFDMREYLNAARLTVSDERALLIESLRRFESGLLVFYFSSVDQNSHILWDQHELELLDFYRSVDQAIGDVKLRAPSAQLLIMSDHGFASFTRAVHLNAWLRDQGLLAERDGKIDWTRTRAYALGLNGLYLNLAGREKYGIVRQGTERIAIGGLLRKKLLEFRDAVDNRAVVETVTTVHAPAFAKTAPDWIVGYAPGYRASWQTALGEVPGSEIEDNIDAWIADHCINAQDVPGVLLTAQPIRLPDPRLTDLPVTILRMFGVQPPPEMHGRSIF